MPAGSIVDLCVFAYAAWTITANLVVIARGNAHALVHAALACLVALAGGLIWLLGNAARRTAWLADLTAEVTPQAPARPDRITAAGLLLVLLALTSAVGGRDDRITWLQFAVASLALSWSALRSHSVSEARAPLLHSETQRVETLVTWLCAAVITSVALLAVRPSVDTAFYVKMASAAVRYPDEALLTVDHMYAITPDTGRVKQVFIPYRVHSHELLAGLLARVTGLATFTVMHVAMVAAFAWLMPFALRRLLRVVAPGHVALLLCALVAFYLVDGTCRHGYAAHGPVSFVEGKSVMLAIGLPLLFAYGLRFGTRPTKWRWAILTAAQIAAMGLSSTALWLAPTVTMVSVLAGTPSLRAAPGRMAASVGSSMYLLILGAWVASQMTGKPAHWVREAEALAALTGVPRSDWTIREAVNALVGDQAAAIPVVLVCVAGIVAAPTALAQRLVAGLVAVAAVAFTNPWLAKAVVTFATGSSTYHRVLWLLPVPLLMAFAAGGLYRVLRGRLPGVLALVVSVALVAGYYRASVQVWLLEAGVSWIFPPAPKLKPELLGAARAVCRWTPEDGVFLATMDVSITAPAIDRCGYPLITYARWMSVTDEDRSQRARMHHMLNEATDVPVDSMASFYEWLQQYRVDAALLPGTAAGHLRLQATLRMHGLEWVDTHDGMRIHAHPPTAAVAQVQRVADAVCALGPDAIVLAPFAVARVLDERRCAHNLSSPARVAKLAPNALGASVRAEWLTSVAGRLDDISAHGAHTLLSDSGATALVLSPSVVSERGMPALLDARGWKALPAVEGYVAYVRPQPQP